VIIGASCGDLNLSKLAASSLAQSGAVTTPLLLFVSSYSTSSSNLQIGSSVSSLWEPRSGACWLDFSRSSERALKYILTRGPESGLDSMAKTGLNYISRGRL
jgi:hypothetical protein